MFDKNLKKLNNRFYFNCIDNVCRSYQSCISNMMNKFNIYDKFWVDARKACTNYVI